MARRPCAQLGCPTLTTATRCAAHARETDRARGARQQRGYGAEHDRMKRDYEQRIAAGEVLTCVRCGRPITDAVTPDHNEARDGYLGPAHPVCNLRAAGQARHGGGGG